MYFVKDKIPHEFVLMLLIQNKDHSMLHLNLFSYTSRIPIIDDNGNFRIRKSLSYFMSECLCVFVCVCVVFWVYSN